MTTYLAILLTFLIGLFGLVFKPDHEGKKKLKSFVAKLTTGGWIILATLILSSLLTVKISYDDSTEKDKKFLTDSLRHHEQILSLMKIGNLEKLNLQMQKVNFESQIKLTKDESEILKLKLEKANTKIATVEDKSNGIISDLLESSQPLFPLNIQLKFRRESICEDEYNYQSPLNNPYLERYSKKRIIALLTAISNNFRVDNVAKGFVVYGKGNDIGFNYPNFKLEYDNNLDSNFIELNKLLNHYLPNITFSFQRNIVSSSKNSSYDLMLISKEEGSLPIDGNEYNIEYSASEDNFNFVFNLNNFIKYSDNSSIKSLYSISNGYLTIGIGRDDDECYVLTDGIRISSGNKDLPLRFFVNPDNHINYLNQEPHGPIIIYGKSFNSKAMSKRGYE